MKVNEVEFAKEVIRSDGWWRYACGDVFWEGTNSIFWECKIIIMLEGKISILWEGKISILWESKKIPEGKIRREVALSAPSASLACLSSQ